MAINQYLNHQGIEIANGQVFQTSYIDKFGYNSAVGTSFETVWDGNNVYTYIETAGTAVATSSNAATDDTAVIEVSGLDANYNEVSEQIIVGGVAGAVEFYRVFRAVLISHPTADTNAGDITITVDTKDAAIITAGYGQTLMALYTIPAGRTGFLVQLDAGSAKDLENEVKIIIRNGTTNVWNTKSFVTLRGTFIEKNWHVPLTIPQKHDIEVRAKGSATTSISAGFQLIVCENK